MKPTNTRERLLETALDLFSRRGYAAVSVRDLAAAVGVRESAIYKHFENKRALYEELVRGYLESSDAFMSSINARAEIDDAQLPQLSALYARMDDAAFVAVGTRVFTEFLMTPPVLRFWRMISIERCNDADMAALFDRELFQKPMAFQARLFEQLVRAGALADVGAQNLALAFYAPALLLYLRILPCAPGDPAVTETLESWRRHMLHFRRTYAPAPKEEGA